ncbi:GNAT family N-acetyltransferase [Bradyrhizobium sp. CSA112]|uniref:GNAT family N-acetyltransferase n=1 Tax=Bradyrhizobium sp. CSA112 TaxID=2699170 RepID=UPI0023B02917|nr:GNAT family N-acetyltransferase [Bradyrhizobium sp. CSA112]MDE5453797.1 GNAT family N-acetyltransferase [Bradyrhizobium sp. CSA112]
MMIEVRQIREDDIESFHAAVDAVAREHKYLALLEAPPMERAQAFVQRNIEKGYPQFVSVADGQVVGWCNIPPASREVMAHVGDLFMGVLPNWRGRGLGERLLRETLMAADAFGYLRIELGVFADNARAASLYRKSGFIEEGIKRRAILINGVFHDEVIMARFRD